MPITPVCPKAFKIFIAFLKLALLIWGFYEQKGRRIAALKADIRKMSREAEAFNSPSTFSTYAKMHREVF